ncbi:MAG: hypothetical protein K6B28_13360 [Lachnospiraceae bacterium]|nr:hypothetical protein [Lachnospiraceae bacterium]
MLNDEDKALADFVIDHSKKKAAMEDAKKYTESGYNFVYIFNLVTAC